jgi:flagellar hook-length control protein FliK
MIRMRLHPPELGAMRLDLVVRNGTVTARLQTETEAASQVLVDSLPALRERLAEHQIKVERLDVQWTGSGLGGSPQQPGGQGRWRDESFAPTSKQGIATAAATDDRSAEAAPRSITRDGGFDVRV